jgi:release factor glutamine methyltransferase
MEFKTIGEARRWASLFLKEHGREEGVADILLMDRLGLTKANLLASLRDPMPERMAKQWSYEIREHAEKGIPVQHLLGYEYFYGRKFHVNPHVLIPRPETEEIVQLVLAEIEKEFSKTVQVVDIGAGSGAIGITLKLENPQLNVKLVDISKEALQVAKENAEQLGADVELLNGSFLEPIIEKRLKVDVIVSNPPYIPLGDKDQLADTVRDFDPALALFGGEDGLDAYRAIMEQLPKVVKKKALIAFEIGYQQGAAVKKLIQSAFPQSHPQIVQDINKKDRIVYFWLQ